MRSDILTDVISIKLYSVQIPYFWYTVNNDCGNNFFFLKGNSPGIDQGYHDYQITIEPGNDESSEFESYINESRLYWKQKMIFHNLLFYKRMMS